MTRPERPHFFGVDMDKMREEFEGWAVENRYDIYRSVLGYYEHGTTDGAWKAWQAARAHPAEHDMKDKRCECCGYMTYQREHMGCIRIAKAQPAGEAVALLQRWLTFGRAMAKAGSRLPRHLIGDTETVLGTDEYNLEMLTIQPGEHPMHKAMEEMERTAPPAQVPDSDGARRIANLLNIFSKQFGKNDDAEGLLEFYGRTHYEQGVEDASRKTQDGWQIVPKEPTSEMLKAIDQHGEYYSDESLKDAYMDMLSIAPQPKGGEHD